MTALNLEHAWGRWMIDMMTAIYEFWMGWMGANHGQSNYTE